MIGAALAPTAAPSSLELDDARAAFRITSPRKPRSPTRMLAPRPRTKYGTPSLTRGEDRVCEIVGRRGIVQEVGRTPDAERGVWSERLVPPEPRQRAIRGARVATASRSQRERVGECMRDRSRSHRGDANGSAANQRMTCATRRSRRPAHADAQLHGRPIALTCARRCVARSSPGARCRRRRLRATRGAREDHPAPRAGERARGHRRREPRRAAGHGRDRRARTARSRRRRSTPGSRTCTSTCSSRRTSELPEPDAVHRARRRSSARCSTARRRKSASTTT